MYLFCVVVDDDDDNDRFQKPTRKAIHSNHILNLVLVPFYYYCCASLVCGCLYLFSPNIRYTAVFISHFAIFLTHYFTYVLFCIHSSIHPCMHAQILSLYATVNPLEPIEFAKYLYVTNLICAVNFFNQFETKTLQIYQYICFKLIMNSDKCFG